MYDLEVINFEEDKIQAITDTRDNSQWVPIKRICENIGITSQTQIGKIKKDPKFNWKDILAVGFDGKNREMVCIPLEEVESFLFNINVQKVGSNKTDEERLEIRRKLSLYQSRCIEVLHEYWNTGEVKSKSTGFQIKVSDRNSLAVQQVVALTQALVDQDLKNQEQDAKLEQHDNRLELLEEKKVLSKADFLPLPVEVEEMQKDDPVGARSELNGLMRFVGENYEGFDFCSNWHHLTESLYRRKKIRLFKTKNETTMEQIVRRGLTDRVYAYAWKLFKIHRFRSEGNNEPE